MEAHIWRLWRSQEAVSLCVLRASSRLWQAAWRRISEHRWVRGQVEGGSSQHCATDIPPWVAGARHETIDNIRGTLLFTYTYRKLLVLIPGSAFVAGVLMDAAVLLVPLGGLW